MYNNHLIFIYNVIVFKIFYKNYNKKNSTFFVFKISMFS